MLFFVVLTITQFVYVAECNCCKCAQCALQQTNKQTNNKTVKCNFTILTIHIQSYNTPRPHNHKQVQRYRWCLVYVWKYDNVCQCLLVKSCLHNVNIHQLFQEIKLSAILSYIITVFRAVNVNTRIGLRDYWLPCFRSSYSKIYFSEVVSFAVTVCNKDEYEIS